MAGRGDALTEGQRLEAPGQQPGWQSERAFASSPTASWFSDLAGRYVSVNEATCRMLGRVEDELLAMTVADVIHPEQREATMRVVSQLGAGAYDDYASERQYVRPDGRSVFANVVTSLVRDGDGNPHLLFSQAQDVTAQRDAQDQLRKRLVQQSVVAELGVAALGGREPGQLMDLAVRAVSDALDVEVASLFEVVPRQILRLRAWSGWPEETAERFEMPIDERTPAGLAMTTGAPVIYEDAESDPRLDDRALGAIGACSGIVV